MHSWLTIFGIILIIWPGCQEPSFEIKVPDYFPEMKIPEDNVPTTARVELGQRLFFDKSLSLDSSISCRSCHLPELAFTDGKAISPGIHGRMGNRNSPSILNAAYLDLINKDGGVRSLELQPLVPIEDENEMGIPIQKLVKRLEKDRHYQKMAMTAYGRNLDAYVITRSLASFVRTLISSDSPYDHFMQGDSTALSPGAQKGLELFRSERLNCTSCHSGFNLTNNQFENNGLYQVYEDPGRSLITLDSVDLGKFRVPSLRNIAITAPYMHDGSLQTLEEVLTHYQKAGQDPTTTQSDKLKSFILSEEEEKQLISFLQGLTDSIYLAEL